VVFWTPGPGCHESEISSRGTPHTLSLYRVIIKMKKLITCVLLFIGSLNAQFASSVPYGQACRGAVLQVDAPRLGSKVSARVPSHPKGSFQPILLGVSLVQQNQDLGNGCYLLVYPMWDWVHLIPHTHRGPNGIYMGLILDDPSSTGLVFFVQAAYLDIDMIPSWTNGVKCTIGY